MASSDQPQRYSCGDGATVRSRHRPAARRTARGRLGRGGGAVRLDPRRRQLLDGLVDAIDALAAAGCRRLWLNGSFVTAKEEPADFDACWDSEGVDIDARDPVLLDLSAGRGAQKMRFGGELLPNVVEVQSGLAFSEFFQNERDTGRKGIVVLRIGGHK